MIAWIFLIAAMWIGVPEPGPQPPCGNDAFPQYADIDKQPITSAWNRSDLGRDWNPPSCTAWTTRGFSSLVVTAGRFRSTASAEDIRRRVGAISELKGMRYWSTTHKKWQTLIVDAYAATGPTTVQRRKDFMAGELSEGSLFYYQQTDNLTGTAFYRMHIMTVSPNRVVFETENVSTMRYLLIPLFHPGDIQSIFFLDRESPDVWRYYSIARTGRNASGLTIGHDASSINRAVAFYRYFAGIPTDMEPPAAR